VWAKDCQSYEGFAKTISSNECISHSDFLNIVQKTNQRFMASLSYCLDKSDKMYIKTRCALIILNRMSPVFPNTYENAVAIQKRL
jgi:hypothetical protein